MKNASTPKGDTSFIKHASAEDFELSERAKAELILARVAPKNTYIRQEDLKKEFSDELACNVEP